MRQSYEKPRAETIPFCPREGFLSASNEDLPVVPVKPFMNTWNWQDYDENAF